MEKELLNRIEWRNPPHKIAATNVRKPKYGEVYVETTTAKVTLKNAPKVLKNSVQEDGYLLLTNSLIKRFQFKTIGGEFIKLPMAIKDKKVSLGHAARDQVSTRTKTLKLAIIENSEYYINNKRTVGTPKYISINNNVLYAQSGGHFTRAKVVSAMKKFIIDSTSQEAVDRFKRIGSSEINFPCTGKLTLIDSPLSDNNSLKWDVDNKLNIWTKVVSDVLKEWIGRDDDHSTINSWVIEFLPIDTTEYTEPTLVFELYGASTKLNRYYASIIEPTNSEG